MNQNIIFRTNNNQQIIIKNICYEKNHMYRYDPVEIFFKDKNKEYLISQHDYLMPKVEAFYYYLKDAIENKLELVPRDENLGYSWNQDLHNTVIKSHEKLKNQDDWQGIKYLMWGGNAIDTWMYNKDGSLFIEITPGYKWHFQAPEKDEDFVSYENWIKKYRPIKLIEIDSNTAHSWMQKLEALMREIESNDARYLHREQDASN